MAHPEDKNIEPEVWERKVIEIALGIDEKEAAKLDHSQLIQKVQLPTGSKENETMFPSFDQLTAKEATQWLILYFNCVNLTLLKQIPITYPKYNPAPKYSTRSGDKGPFENLLITEIAAYELKDTVELDWTRLNQSLVDLLEVLDTHNAVTYYRFEPMLYAQKFPESVLIPHIKYLYTVGSSYTHHVPNDALTKYPLLESLNISIFDYSKTPLPPAIFQLEKLQELIINSCELIDLPPQIESLKNLTTLFLYGNQFKMLPEVVFKLPQLENLHLEHNQLSDLPDNFSQLKSLQNLNLGHNQLSDLPDNFSQLKSLHNLNLSHNQFTEFPAALVSNAEIEYIDLSFNSITTLPEEIIHNGSNIDLANNLIDYLPDEVKDKEKGYLTLKGNPLRDIPEKLAAWVIRQYWYQLPQPDETEITTLFCWMNFHQHSKMRNGAKKKLEAYLEQQEGLFDEIKADWRYRKNPDPEKLIDFVEKYCQKLKFDWRLLEVWLESFIPDGLTSFSLFRKSLETIPVEFFQLSTIKNIGSFSCFDAELTDVSDKIAGLKKLHNLSLAKNALDTLPEFVGEFPLQQINLRVNRFTEVPKLLGKIPTLELVYLAGNRIQHNLEILTNLPNLRELYLENNQITELPQEFTQLKKLKVLSLNNNKLGITDAGQNQSSTGYSLPLEISHLDNLEELYLSKNPGIKIPPGVGLMENLKKISLSDNQLTEFPEVLCELDSVELLRLQNNQISFIPASIQHLTRLEFLYLEGNPLTTYEKKKVKGLLPNTNIFF